MTALFANSSGNLTAKFTIPSNIGTGDKLVSFFGVGGSKGDAIFSSQGTLQRKVLQVETTVTETRWQSPPPPPPVYEPSPTYTAGPTTGADRFDLAVAMITSATETMASRGFPGVANIISDMLPDLITKSHASDTAGIIAADQAFYRALEVTQEQLIRSENGGNTPNNFVGYDTLALAHQFQACATDPLAQTFSLSAASQLTAIDLWFTAKGTGPVRIDIRTTSNGYPTTTVLASATVAAASILTNGTSTRVTFPAPVALLADTEYAFVVMANDATTAVSIAELGKWDAVSSQWVTNQPYTVGVLLSSSNAITWTAHQDKDMAFQLLMASYTATSRTIALGTVAVTGVTDLMLMSYAEKPTAATHVDYTLTLPDLSTVTVSDGQSVRLAAAITGNVLVSATLNGDATASPVLTPGTQLAYGTVATSADYITRAIPAGSAARVKVIFEALIPSGASVAVSVKGIDGGDTWAAAAYQSSSQLGEGWMEMTHELASITEASVHVKLALAGNTNARPRVRNLRVIVL